MIIRKNTKAFKSIVGIVTACEARPDRNKLIRLYITKAGHSVEDRISIEAIEEETDVFYNLTYAAVLENLKSSDHQLHSSDDIDGLYYFHTTSNKVWDQNPFEFDDRIAKEFTDVEELPITRKRGTPIKPPPPAKQKGKSKKKEATPARKSAPKQPAYKLKHKIEFTDLNKVVIKRSGLTKRDILDYYNEIAGYILPYLKDRPQLIRLRSERGGLNEYQTGDDLTPNAEELPAGIHAAITTPRSKTKQDILFCNTKEHLLYYIERGAVDFYPQHVRAKSATYPDYCVLGIEAGGNTPEKVIDVARMSHHILTALNIPSFIKTDGTSGFQIYIPLDGKSSTDDSQALAQNICKLVLLKFPDRATLRAPGEYSLGKIILDCHLNDNQQTIVAPYSIAADTATVATPLYWEEVTKGLSIEKLNYKTTLKRLKETGDPFEDLFKKKINAKEIAAHIEKHYAFLF
jgi:bifunctional non-homologous end joining protein LigD